MGGKPFQSSLIPYQEEIARLRSARPPVSYARIAALLREEHGLNMRRGAIAKFVKARSGGRKVYFFRKEAAAKQSVPVPATVQAVRAVRDTQVAATAGQEIVPPKFEFTYSERYNLKRRPKDVAAAIRKRLEAEGH